MALCNNVYIIYFNKPLTLDFGAADYTSHGTTPQVIPGILHEYTKCLHNTSPDQWERGIHYVLNYIKFLNWSFKLESEINTTNVRAL
jgi:hypothetical protein